MKWKKRSIPTFQYFSDSLGKGIGILKALKERHGTTVRIRRCLYAQPMQLSVTLVKRVVDVRVPQITGEYNALEPSKGYLAIGSVPFMAYASAIQMRIRLGTDEGNLDASNDGTNTPGGVIVETLVNIRTVSALTLERRRFQDYKLALLVRAQLQILSIYEWMRIWIVLVFPTVGEWIADLVWLMVAFPLPVPLHVQ